MESDINTFYNANGYFHCKNLIPKGLIEELLSYLENFKKNNSLYYSQSEHNWRKTNEDIDQFGLLNSSLENFTDLLWAPNLSKAGRKILQSSFVLDILKEISGEDNFCMWQNMLFDKSTGTIDHVDSWYLDTNPIGNLIAGWFALEDIKGDGGSFHIFPGSHKGKLSWKNLSHEEFIEWNKKEINKYKLKEIKINMGDVLFWHPLLIHGSSSQIIEGKSRKSLTAHYFPINYLKGGGGLNNLVRDGKYESNLKIQNKSLRHKSYPIFSSSKLRSRLHFCFKGFYKYLVTENIPSMLMNRKSYENN